MRDSFKNAVVEYLACPSGATGKRLCTTHKRDWSRMFRWMDEAGITLYLADSLQRTGWFASLPAEVQSRMSTNLNDSRLRARAMNAEFLRLVTAFQKLPSTFAAHKGIALVPE